MFLPVLLIRDYGNAAFWIFAVPNVIGAAAMGWVMRSPERSRAFVARHEFAVRAFTLVTVAFHAFFIGWICQLKGDALWPVLAGFGMVAWMAPLARRSVGAGALGTAVIALLASAALGGALLATLRRIDLAAIVDRRDDAAPTELMALTLVCGFGFLACPYLDATFHHARQRLSAPAAARWGFGVGFGVVFAAMIGLSYAYADVINLNATLRGVAGSLIVGHMVIQAAATVSLHLATSQPRWPRWTLLATATAALGLMGGGWATDARQGEAVYRLFMGFYGLAAPAYVWICAVGSRGTAPARRDYMAFGAVTIVAAPFYWIAFVEGRLAWAAAGVIIALSGRFLASPTRKGLAAADE